MRAYTFTARRQVNGDRATNHDDRHFSVKAMSLYDALERAHFEAPYACRRCDLELLAVDGKVVTEERSVERRTQNSAFHRVKLEAIRAQQSAALWKALAKKLKKEPPVTKFLRARIQYLQESTLYANTMEANHRDVAAIACERAAELKSINEGLQKRNSELLERARTAEEMAETAEDLREGAWLAAENATIRAHRAHEERDFWLNMLAGQPIKHNRGWFTARVRPYTFMEGSFYESSVS